MCRLKKSLYGLKQAPRKWHLKFDRFIIEQGYNRCHACCRVLHARNKCVENKID